MSVARRYRWTSVVWKRRDPTEFCTTMVCACSDFGYPLEKGTIYNFNEKDVTCGCGGCEQYVLPNAERKGFRCPTCNRIYLDHLLVADISPELVVIPERSPFQIPAGVGSSSYNSNPTCRYVSNKVGDAVVVHPRTSAQVIETERMYTRKQPTYTGLYAVHLNSLSRLTHKVHGP